MTVLFRGSVAGRPMNILPHHYGDLGRGVGPLGEAVEWQSSVKSGTTEAGNPKHLHRRALSYEVAEPPLLAATTVNCLNAVDHGYGSKLLPGVSRKLSQRQRCAPEPEDFSPDVEFSSNNRENFSRDENSSGSWPTYRSGIRGKRLTGSSLDALPRFTPCPSRALS